MFVCDHLMMARGSRNMLWGKEVNVSINIIVAIAGICLTDLCYTRMFVTTLPQSMCRLYNNVGSLKSHNHIGLHGLLRG
jgi:hypothetical protein